MVRFARYHLGEAARDEKGRKVEYKQHRKAHKASTWEEMANAPADNSDDESEATLAAQEAKSVGHKKPKLKSKVTQFAAKGLEEYESLGSKLPTASPSGIADDLQKLAPVKPAMEIIKDIPKVKTSLKKKKKKLPAKGLVEVEVEKIKNKGNLTAGEEGELDELIKKDRRREERRQKRIDERDSSKVCYNCREAGHTVGDCPKMKGKSAAIDDHGGGICFKCGSTEHRVDRCRAKLPPGVYPYAKCFICGEKGHLSKQCVDNPRGLYPNGGCCMVCSSVEHFQRDCPEGQKMQGIDDVKLSTYSRSADDDNLLVEEKAPRRRIGPKIVKF